jgi:hypothetical protein
MTDWIQLDASRFDRAQLKTIRGVEVKVFLSPYDVPEALRGAYDEELKRFVIEFQYISDEPLKRRTYDQYVTTRLGRNSNRLYAIEIDVDAMRVETVNLSVLVQEKVDGVLAGLIREPIDVRRIGNYQLAQQAISNEHDQLFSRFSQSNSGSLMQPSLAGR